MYFRFSILAVDVVIFFIINLPYIMNWHISLLWMFLFQFTLLHGEYMWIYTICKLYDNICIMTQNRIFLTEAKAILRNIKENEEG